MRRIAMVLAVMMLLSVLSIPVSADSDIQLEQLLINAVNTGNKVDISSFGISSSELVSVYQKLYMTGRLPWYADNSCQWTETSGGKVVEYTPKQFSEFGYDGNIYERMINELLFETCGDGMLDWQKILSIHDYIAIHVSYDETYRNNSGYAALVQGSSACEGYTQLFLDCMRRIGIPCQMVSNDSLGGIGHTWNIVQLEGVWYHVDVTWDDPTPNVQGRVLHEYFLRSDTQFRTGENDHGTTWTAYESCIGGKYSDGMFWDGIDSAICIDDDGAMFHMKAKDGINKITRTDVGLANSDVIYSGEQIVLDIGQGTAQYPTMGLSIRNERLYFNTPIDIRSITLDGKDERIEYIHDTAGTRQFVLGTFVDLEYIAVSFAGSDMKPVDSIVPLSDPFYHVHSYSASGQVSASCAEGGGTVMCCDCGVRFLMDKSPALSHDLEQTKKDGGTYYTCRECGFSFADSSLQQSGSGLWWLWIVFGLVAVVVVVVIILILKKREEDARRRRMMQYPVDFF